jgi:hypothetical protein
MEIIPEPVSVDKVKVARKGVGGVVVTTLAYVIVSFFHGLTPEQKAGAMVATVGVLESVRGTLKSKFPKLFSFL